MKNRKLIRMLKKERRKLYPHGLPIQPRGCDKTYLYMSHFLLYTSYDFVIDIYKRMEREATLEEAHNDMKDYINEMWKLKDF